jgi:hypothetical protein
MGLYVHSIGEIPNGTERGYYVYLLDYGWSLWAVLSGRTFPEWLIWLRAPTRW